MELKSIHGYENEKKIIEYLNGSLVKEVNPLFQELLEYLYGKDIKNARIGAWKAAERVKPDIVLVIDGVRKRISVKMGARNSVHVETIGDFVAFLKQSNISTTLIDKFLLYHYADGTTDGSGKNRIGVKEYQVSNLDSINSFNEAVNTQEVIERAVDRFLFDGIRNKRSVDVILYGTKDDFLWITRDEVKLVLKEKPLTPSSGIHIGPFFIQPWARVLNYNKRYEHRRHCIQAKWYSLFDIVIEAMSTVHRK